MRVLLVDEDSEARGRVAVILRAGLGEVELEEVVDAEGLAEALDRPAPSALITEHRLSWTSGTELLARLRQLWPELPAILLVAQGSEALAAQALETGFDNYLGKTAEDLSRLPAALSACIERRGARRAVAESADRYREFFESLPLPLYLSLVDGVLLGANPALVQLLGYPDRDALLGTNMADLYVDRGGRGRWMRDVLAAGSVQGYEVQLRRFDGSLIWVRETTRAVWGEDGESLVFQGSLEDVSERRAAEQALARRHAILEAVTFAAARFLKTESWKSAVPAVLERLGGAARVSRAYLVQLVRRGLSVSAAGGLVEWQAPGVEPRQGGPGIEPVDFERDDLRRWLEAMGRGEVVASAVGGLPDQERRLLAPPGVVSVAMVPVFVGDVLWGYFGLDDCSGDRQWSAGELDALRAAADILGAAVDLGRARHDVARRSEELEILNRINELLASTLDAATVMQEITDLVRVRCGVEHVSVALVSEGGEELSFIAWSGYDASLFEASLPLAGPGIVARAVRERRSIHLPDVTGSPDYLCGDVRVRSEYAIPLISGDQVFGVLNCESFTADGIGEWERRVIDRLAAQAAIALRNADTYRRLQIFQARYRDLVEHLPEGVVMLDGDRRVLLTNPAAEEALATLASTDERGALGRLGSLSLETLLESCEDGLPVEVTSEGAPVRIFEAVARSVRSEGGAEWVVVLREVTAEREAERQLRMQERLAAVGQLAAGIAHDFNNLLQAISLHSELAGNEVAPESRPALRLATIRKQAAEGALLIRQILDFARTTMTKPRTLDLAPFLKESVNLLKAAVPESVRIELRLGTGTYRVVADPAQIQQLLANLATNAADAMPAGGELRIGLTMLRLEPDQDSPCPHMEPGPWVELKVEDTGCGMSPEVQERALEPFFTTKGPGRGTGMGLAQVYGIVKQHGGHLAVRSDEGRGSTVTAYLPVAEPDAAVEQTPANPIEEPRAGGNELVLLVEDDPVILEIARDGLQSLGFLVVCASDGRQALEVHDRLGDEIALVLSDMVMPELGGVELARRLQERGARAGVLLMTGYPLDQDANGDLGRGVLDWIQKPFTLAQLSVAIDRALGRG